MKLIVDDKLLDGNISSILTRNGYVYIVDKVRNKESYILALTVNRYPRLHLYIKNDNSVIFLDLHLDQKEVSYKGSHMHNAEYDGEVVLEEILRLKKLLGGGTVEQSFKTKDSSSKEVKVEHSEPKKVGLIDVGEVSENKLGKGDLDLDEVVSSNEKKWWKFW